MYTRKSSIAAVKRQHEMEQASTSKTFKICRPRTRTRVSELGLCFKNIV